MEPREYNTVSFRVPSYHRKASLPHPSSLSKMKSEVQLESIDQLTPDFFQGLLHRANRFQGKVIPKVTKLLVERVEQGVLSRVFRIDVSYDADRFSLPSQWILKLRREDLQLDWMFQRERAFYELRAPSIIQEDFPFTIPSPLHASDTHIIIEFVPDCICHPLVDGCPPDRIAFLTEALARLHAATWRPRPDDDDDDVITSPPGMGQRLSPLQKEHLFAKKWAETLGRVNVSKRSSKDVVADLCQRMSTLRLRDIHFKIHDRRQQLAYVHGDYHIANWLFPEKKGDDRKPVLIDWATCGYGNPMVDAVFFLVVSTNDNVVGNLSSWIEQYYRFFADQNPAAALQMPLEKLKQRIQWALLGQWMILVTYDEMCRGIAQKERITRKREQQLNHFENVNRRALLAINCFSNWEDLLVCIPTLSEEEKLEATEFTLSRSLEI